jgi:hypothetical protein
LVPSKSTLVSYPSLLSLDLAWPPFANCSGSGGGHFLSANPKSRARLSRGCISVPSASTSKETLICSRSFGLTLGKLFEDFDFAAELLEADGWCMLDKALLSLALLSGGGREEAVA